MHDVPLTVIDVAIYIFVLPSRHENIMLTKSNIVLCFKKGGEYAANNV